VYESRGQARMFDKKIKVLLQSIRNRRDPLRDLFVKKFRQQVRHESRSMILLHHLEKLHPKDSLSNYRAANGFHHFFLDFCLAYSLFKDKKYLDAVERGYRLSLRFNWLDDDFDLTLGTLAPGFVWAHDLLCKNKRISDDQKILTRIEDYCRRLEVFIDAQQNQGRAERFNNNRLIAGSTALGFFSHFFKLSRSRDWFQKTKTVIDHYMIVSDKVGPEGDWFEGSASYQFFMLHYFIYYTDLCFYENIFDYYDVPKIRRMFSYFRYYLTEKGGVVNFNDCGYVRGDKVWILLKGAVVNRDQVLLKLFLNVARKFKWLNQGELLFFYENTPAWERKIEWPADRHFTNTGQVVARSNWNKTAHLFAFDCGRQTHHDHFDKGHFEFQYRGIPLFTDAGVDDYTHRKNWLGPEMHNVVNIRERFSYQPPDEKAWWNHFYPGGGRILDFITQPYFCWVRGDFSEAVKAKSAQRSILFNKDGYLIIQDHISDTAAVTFDTYFHGRGKLKIKGGSPSWRSPEGIRFYVKPHLSTGYKIKTGTRLSMDKMHGQNRILTERHESYRIVTKGRVHHAVYFIGVQGSHYHFRSLQDGELTIISVQHKNKARDLWISQPLAEKINYQNILFKGKRLFLRTVENRLIYWFVDEGDCFWYEGQELLTASYPTARQACYIKEPTHE